MSKKILFVPLVLCVILLSEMAGECFADASAQLEQAETYQKQGQYGQAEGIYQKIVTDCPDTNDAFHAQKNLTILYVEWDRPPQAEAALQKLIADFSGYDGIATAVTYVADTYHKSKQHEKACEIYQYVIDNWPQDEHAMWSRMGLVISNTCLGNDNAAQTAFERLCTEYSGYELISKAVCFVADNYRKLKKHEKAREYYQYVLANWPDGEGALWSQMGLAISNIQRSNFDDAESAINKLHADFSRDERMATAACLIADEYRKLEKHGKACELYQYVVDNWPEAEYTLWSGMGLAISNIRVGDFDSAGAAVEKLFNDFFEDERMATACCLIGDEYRKLEKPEKALVLYQYVVDNWPNAEHAMWSQMNLAISNTALKNGDAARAAIDKLPVDFSEQPKFPSAVFQIGELYYRQAFLREREDHHAQAKQYLQKAIAKWETIITDLPESITTAWAYNFAADCYRRLGQHQIAVEYYQMVVDDWPDYEYAWDALFRIGRNYENRMKSGLMSKAEANPKIRAVYEQVLEQYPDCKAAMYARRWLTRRNYK